MLTVNNTSLIVECSVFNLLCYSLATHNACTHIYTWSLDIPAQDLQCILFVMAIDFLGVSNQISETGKDR